MSIRRLLIANRGEIVSRVARTARRLGIQTVGVFTDSDAGAAYLDDVDRSVALGRDDGATPYLDAGAILDAARRSGADAVHPGYGFLAENADFAQACGESGLVWVGPSPEAIRAMGLKIEAKQTARRAGVRILDGVTVSADPSAITAATTAIAAAGLRLPLLVKPSAGGGGKGMRRVDDLADLPATLQAAQREATAAFGDGTLFVERYVETARHVEVQVFGDGFGEVVHLGARDCSVQRRHQKIIEEAPPIDLPADLLAELTAAAVRLTQELGYLGAGTVEFLVYGGEYAFLEMNTRLQVEHAVTEEVTGLDLVEWQLRVAAGGPLPAKQDDIVLSGHSIEARLYAEDPAAGFLPSPGTVAWFSQPDLPGVRWERGVRAGSVVNPRYDPMIAKVVAHGRSRDEAIERLRAALEGTRVGGVRTNRALLLAVLDAPDFRAAAVSTDYLTRRDDLLAQRSEPQRSARAIAAALHATLRRRVVAPVQPFTSPGWRNLRSQDETVAFVVDGEQLTVGYRVDRGGLWTVTLDERPHAVRVHGHDEAGIDLEVDALRQRYRIAAHGTDTLVESDGDVSIIAEAAADAGGEAGVAETVATAPLPGKVVAVLVAAGDAVAAGDTLMVIEAMKMEHRVTAPGPAVVLAILVATGDTVDYQQPLIHIEAA